MFIALFVSQLVGFGQETKHYFGTSTNNLGTGGIIALDITFNPDKNIVGFVDNDPYPSLSNICGMGNISGKIENNKVSLEYISFERDPILGVSFIPQYFHLFLIKINLNK